MSRLKRLTLKEKALLPPPMDLTQRMRMLLTIFRMNAPKGTKTLVLGPETLKFADTAGLLMEYTDGSRFLAGYPVAIDETLKRYELRAA